MLSMKMGMKGEMVIYHEGEIELTNCSTVWAGAGQSWLHVTWNATECGESDSLCSVHGKQPAHGESVTPPNPCQARPFNSQFFVDGELTHGLFDGDHPKVQTW